MDNRNGANMSDKEMAGFLQKLRNKNEMPINEDEYYLIGEIAERLIELSELKAELKEQEAIPVDTKVIGTFNGDMEVYCCRDCRTILDPAFHYCPNCGQEVKWDD